MTYDGITPEKKAEMMENGNVTLILAQRAEKFMPIILELLEK